MHPPTFRVVSGEAGSIRNSKLVLLSSASVGFVVAKNQRIGSSYDVYKTTRHVFFHGRVPASLFNGSRFDSTFTPLPLPSLFLSAPTHSRARLEGERWPFVYRAIGSKMEEPLLGTKGRAPFQKIFFFFFISKPSLPPSFLVAWRKHSLFSRVASIAKNIFQDFQSFAIFSPRLPKICSRKIISDSLQLELVAWCILKKRIEEL